MTKPLIVVKIGGGLLADPAAFARAVAVVDTADDVGLVVVAGGGPFADAVRDVDRRFGLGDDEAHWMAVLGMDQYAHMLEARLTRGRLATSDAQVQDALRAGAVPVIAPYAWLRQADPLPHAWHVTSDSIAAWLAAQLDARSLVLVKPPLAAEPLVDDYFTRACPPGLHVVVAPADEQLHTVFAAC